MINTPNSYLIYLFELFFLFFLRTSDLAYEYGILRILDVVGSRFDMANFLMKLGKAQMTMKNFDWFRIFVT